MLEAAALTATWLEKFRFEVWSAAMLNCVWSSSDLTWRYEGNPWNIHGERLCGLGTARVSHATLPLWVRKHERVRVLHWNRGLLLQRHQCSVLRGGLEAHGHPWAMETACSEAVGSQQLSRSEQFAHAPGSVLLLQCQLHLPLLCSAVSCRG